MTTPSTGIFLPGLDAYAVADANLVGIDGDFLAVAKQPALAGKDLDQFVNATLGAGKCPGFETLAGQGNEHDLGGDERLVDQDRRDASQSDRQVGAKPAGKERIDRTVEDAGPAEDRREECVAIAEEVLRPVADIGNVGAHEEPGDEWPKVASDQQAQDRRERVEPGVGGPGERFVGVGEFAVHVAGRFRHVCCVAVSFSSERVDDRFAM